MADTATRKQRTRIMLGRYTNRQVTLGEPHSGKCMIQCTLLIVILEQGACQLNTVAKAISALKGLYRRITRRLLPQAQSVSSSSSASAPSPPRPAHPGLGRRSQERTHP